MSENCYAVLGLACYPPWTVNAGFIAGAAQTLVVDASAGRLSAQTLYGYACSVRPNNRLLLVNTEKHLDHLGGNCLFADNGVPIYGHALIDRKESDLAGDKEFYNSTIQEPVRRAAHEEEVFYSGTRIVNPTRAVSNKQVFDLGGIEARILLTPGHTETNLSVHVPSDEVLYTGDAVVQGFIPNLENSTPDGWKQWLDSLDVIASLKLRALVPGHGVVLVSDDIPRELDRIRQILRSAIKTGSPPTS
ncbi:MAG TPA: MBL fold metallo-hydrolase [Bacteroidota bacterium]|nr:MBL fold metallo-hydrolase [Bacteroidota bacterium]